MLKTRERSAAARTGKPTRSAPALRGKGARGATADAKGNPSKANAIGVRLRGNDSARKATNVIRDSFTMPVRDYELIGALKSKCIGLGLAVKKSELLRAGLHALTQISDENLARVIAAVESVKTGRPRGKKKRKKTDRAKGKKR
jgi:hypothetical protein